MRYVEVPLALQVRRLVSLDALRGFNFIWILGGEGAVLALATILEGKGELLGKLSTVLAAQMKHAPWEGFTFYDFIFPLFIFITGVAIVLSLPRLVEAEGRARAHRRVLQRALLIYILGVVYYGGFSISGEDIRYVGVLQRIAICYLFASLLFLHLDWRGLAAACVALLGGYWALMTFVPVPGVGAGSFAPDANLANWFDANFQPGRLWDGTRDPEGLFSTLSAIASCLLGVFAGLLLQDGRVAPDRKAIWLIGAGLVLLAAGYVWSLQFPIIKALWTSSYVLVAAGYSAILLGAAYHLIDVWGYKRWATVLVWIGANAITLYMINGIVGFAPLAQRFVGGDVALWIAQTVTKGTGSLVVHIVALAFVIALAGYLYRRKIFLRV